MLKQNKKKKAVKGERFQKAAFAVSVLCPVYLSPFASVLFAATAGENTHFHTITIHRSLLKQPSINLLAHVVSQVKE